MPGACEFQKTRSLSSTSNQSNGREASCPPPKAVITPKNLPGTNQSATVGAGLRPARVQPLAAILLVADSNRDPPQVAQALLLVLRNEGFILRTEGPVRLSQSSGCTISGSMISGLLR